VALLSQRDFLVEGLGDLPQCDELCGPFWAANALRAAGFRDVTQEQAAVVAGSVLAPAGSPSSLPAGERGRRAASELPVGEPAGTSAHGVARAVQMLSDGRLAAVPATGDWTSAKLLDLLEAVDGAVIANVFTGELWGSSVTDEHVRRYLEAGIDEGPANDWRVGHFVAVAHVVRGGVAPLIVLADSYPSCAMHRQPAERVVAALRGRGLLVVTDEPDAVRERVVAAGLEPVLWDNGSPQP
jgi:hypothetical protein